MHRTPAVQLTAVGSSPLHGSAVGHQREPGQTQFLGLGVQTPPHSIGPGASATTEQAHTPTSPTIGWGSFGNASPSTTTTIRSGSTAADQHSSTTIVRPTPTKPFMALKTSIISRATIDTATSGGTPQTRVAHQFVNLFRSSPPPSSLLAFLNQKQAEEQRRKQREAEERKRLTIPEKEVASSIIVPTEENGHAQEQSAVHTTNAEKPAVTTAAELLPAAASSTDVGLTTENMEIEPTKPLLPQQLEHTLPAADQPNSPPPPKADESVVGQTEVPRTDSQVTKATGTANGEDGYFTEEEKDQTNRTPNEQTVDIQTQTNEEVTTKSKPSKVRTSEEHKHSASKGAQKRRDRIQQLEEQRQQRLAEEAKRIEEEHKRKLEEREKRRQAAAQSGSSRKRRRSSGATSTSDAQSPAIAHAESPPKLAESPVIAASPTAEPATPPATSTQRDPAAESTNSITLVRWYIKWLHPHAPTPNIFVEGLRKDALAGSGEVYWHSSTVVKRRNARSLLTKKGTEYRLDGQIDRAEALRLGFSEDLISAFEKGFPVTWKKLLKREASKKQASVNGASSRQASTTATTTAPSATPPSTTAPQTLETGPKDTNKPAAAPPSSVTQRALRSRRKAGDESPTGTAPSAAFSLAASTSLTPSRTATNAAPAEQQPPLSIPPIAISMDNSVTGPPPELVNTPTSVEGPETPKPSFISEADLAVAMELIMTTPHDTLRELSAATEVTASTTSHGDTQPSVEVAATPSEEIVSSSRRDDRESERGENTDKSVGETVSSDEAKQQPLSAGAGIPLPVENERAVSDHLPQLTIAMAEEPKPAVSVAAHVQAVGSPMGNERSPKKSAGAESERGSEQHTALRESPSDTSRTRRASRKRGHADIDMVLRTPVAKHIRAALESSEKGDAKPVTPSRRAAAILASPDTVPLAALESLPVVKATRSGRHVLPPLAFWRNQMVARDALGNILGIHSGSPEQTPAAASALDVAIRQVKAGATPQAQSLRKRKRAQSLDDAGGSERESTQRHQKTGKKTRREVASPSAVKDAGKMEKPPKKKRRLADKLDATATASPPPAATRLSGADTTEEDDYSSKKRTRRGNRRIDDNKEKESSKNSKRAQSKGSGQKLATRQRINPAAASSGGEEEEEWTGEQIKQLHEAQSRVDPKDRHFWKKVGEHVLGKTAEECQKKWASLFPTPVAPVRKPKAAPISETQGSEDGLIPTLVGGLGTAKRKQNLRKLLEKAAKELPAGDSAYNPASMESAVGVSNIVVSDDEEEALPKAGSSKVSPNKSPPPNSEILKQIDRKQVDHYITRWKRTRSGGASLGIPPSKVNSTTTAPQSGFTLSRLTEGLTAEEQTEVAKRLRQPKQVAVDEEEEEQEQDYYFSE